MTITEFLIARITEDEERARARIETMTTAAERWDSLPEDMRALIDVRREHRSLVECQTKRAIIQFREECDQAVREGIRTGDEAVKAGARTSRFTLDQVLQVMALAYSDHQDYRQEWKP